MVAAMDEVRVEARALLGRAVGVRTPQHKRGAVGPARGGGRAYKRHRVEERGEKEDEQAVVLDAARVGAPARRPLELLVLSASARRTRQTTHRAGAHAHPAIQVSPVTRRSSTRRYTNG